MSLIRRSPLILALALAPTVVAQQSADEQADQPAQPAQPVQQAQPAQPAQADEDAESGVVFRQVPPRRGQQARRDLDLPPFESLVIRGEDGTIERITRQLDLLALQRNVLIDDETRDRIRPVLREWLADLDQLVIDNLDFIEAIEPPDGSPGVVDKVNLNDQATVQPVGRMMNMLISTGPLTPHLQNRGVLTTEQAALNERIKSDYLQAVMNEVLAANQVRPGEELQNEQQRTRQVNTIARHVYGVSALDAMSSYYRQLSRAAPFAGEIAQEMQMSDDIRRALQPLIEAAEQAEGDEDRRVAVRKVLNELNFDQRRDFLQRAKKIVPEQDLLTPTQQ